MEIMNYLKNGYLLLNKFIVLSKLDDYNNVNILKQGILSLYQNKNTLRILEKSIEGVFFSKRHFSYFKIK